MVLVLSGPVHAGKTTFLERSLPLWAARGLSCAGFISPAVTDEAGETGYDLVEIATGRRLPYLRRHGLPGAERIGPYVFVPETLERARTIIRETGPPDSLSSTRSDRSSFAAAASGGPPGRARSAGADAPLRRPRGHPREFAARLAPLIPAVFDVNDADARMLLEKRLFETSQPHDGQS